MNIERHLRMQAEKPAVQDVISYFESESRMIVYRPESGQLSSSRPFKI